MISIPSIYKFTLKSIENEEHDKNDESQTKNRKFALKIVCGFAYDIMCYEISY